MAACMPGAWAGTPYAPGQLPHQLQGNESPHEARRIVVDQQTHLLTLTSARTLCRQLTRCRGPHTLSPQPHVDMQQGGTDAAAAAPVLAAAHDLGPPTTEQASHDSAQCQLGGCATATACTRHAHHSCMHHQRHRGAPRLAHKRCAQLSRSAPPSHQAACWSSWHSHQVMPGGACKHLAGQPANPCPAIIGQAVGWQLSTFQRRFEQCQACTDR
jgi:hypothetical protein